MNEIRWGRKLLGGLVAGIVIFVVMGVVNGALLSADWLAVKPMIAAMGHPPSMNVSMGLWLLMALIIGQVITFVYVGIRPRFGAGPATALRAGVVVWVAAYLSNFLNQTALGILPSHINGVICIGALVASLLAALIGGAIYKE